MSTPAAPSPLSPYTPPPEGDAQRKVVVVDSGAPSLEFRQWPLRDEPVASLIVLCVVAAISCGIGMLAESPAWGLATAAGLLVSLWRMWIPVEFHLCELGVIQTALRRSWRTPWDALAGYEVRSEGILLLPEDDDSVLGRLRGLYIPYGRRKDDILAIVAYFFDEDSSTEPADS